MDNNILRLITFFCSFFFMKTVHASYIPTQEETISLHDAIEVGVFEYKNGLVLDPKNSNISFWKTKKSYSNCIIRINLDIGQNLGTKILFRSQMTSPSSFNGYSLSFQDRNMTIVKNQNGKEEKLSPSQIISKKVDAIEVVITSWKQYHSIFIYNDKNGEQIGSFFFENDSFSSGIIGIGLDPMKDRNTHIRSIGINEEDPPEDFSISKIDAESILKKTPSVQSGKWSTENGLIFLEPTSTERYMIWAPNHRNYTNGVVQSTIELGSKPDISLLFRASIPDTNTPSGYSLSVENKNVLIYRWDFGNPRVIAKLESIPKNIEAIDIKITSFDLTHSIVVSNTKTGVIISSGQVSDGRWTNGNVAIRVHPNQSQNTKVKRLTIQGISFQDIRFENKLDIFGQEGRAIIQRISVPEIKNIPDVTWFRTGTKGEEIVFTRREAVKDIQKKGGIFSELHWKIPYIYKNIEYRKALEEINQKTYNPLKTNSYRDPNMLRMYLEAMQNKYPQYARIVHLGETRQGTEILALRISDNPELDEFEPMILMDSAHHGSELLSIEYSLDAIRYLLEGTKNRTTLEYVNNFDTWIIPLLNPDGNWSLWHDDHNIGRKNSWDVNGNGSIEYNEGTDLNRNYPFQWHSLEEKGSSSFYNHSWFRGYSPSSEPETNIMIQLAKKYHPSFVISWHTSGNMILSPYTIDGVPNPQPDHAWAVAEKLIADMEKAPYHKRKISLQRNMYSVDGTDQDWHYFAHGSLAYIIEGTHHNPPPQIRDLSVSYMSTITKNLFSYMSTGPRIFGKITDEKQNPVEAVIEILEHKQYNNEQWGNRILDGRFDRVLSSNATISIRVSAKGYTSQTKKITVHGPTKVNFILQTSK